MRALFGLTVLCGATTVLAIDGDTSNDVFRHGAGVPLRNVLLITIDDLRPQLNLSYGMVQTSTPNLDRLAASAGATTFRRAYCQMAVCSPSRNSFMSESQWS